MFEPKVFREQMHCICTVLKQVLVTLLGLYGASRSHLEPP